MAAKRIKFRTLLLTERQQDAGWNDSVSISTDPPRCSLAIYLLKLQRCLKNDGERVAVSQQKAFRLVNHIQAFVGGPERGEV